MLVSVAPEADAAATVASTLVIASRAAALNAVRTAVPALLKTLKDRVPALLNPAKVVCPVVVTFESVVLFVMLPSWPRSAIVHVLAAWEKSIRFPTTYSPAEVLVIANVIG